MKFEYLKDLRGPNGERFGEEPVDFRAPLAGEWFVNLAGTVEKAYTGRGIVGPRLILRRLIPSTVNPEPEPEYEEIPVYASNHGWQIAGEWLPAHWAGRTDFAGAVYEHPNGHWRVLACTHPLFVDPKSIGEMFGVRDHQTAKYSHMIRPVAIRRKVAK